MAATQANINLDYLKAAQAGDLAGLKSALDAGAELYVCNSANGWGALNYAIAGRFLPLIGELVSRGYALNPAEEKRGFMTPLIFALSAERPLTESARELIRLGADVNLHNRSGYDALMACLDVRNTEGITLVMREGNNPDPSYALENLHRLEKGDVPARIMQHFLDERDALLQRRGEQCADAALSGAEKKVGVMKPPALRRKGAPAP